MLKKVQAFIYKYKLCGKVTVIQKGDRKKTRVNFYINIMVTEDDVVQGRINNEFRNFLFLLTKSQRYGTTACSIEYIQTEKVQFTNVNI